jgi:hypothetical protein
MSHAAYIQLVGVLGIAEGGESYILGVWQGATENTAVVKAGTPDWCKGNRGTEDV